MPFLYLIHFNLFVNELILNNVFLINTKITNHNHIAYLSSNCHVEIIVKEKDVQVKKEKNENTAAKVRLNVNVKKGVRQATAAALRKRKWVQVGKN